MRISPSDLCQWTSETLGDSLKVSSSSQKGTWSQFPGDSILIFSLFLPLRSMMLLLSLEIVIVPSFCLPTQWLNLDIFLESSNLIESYITGKFIGNIYCPFSCSEDYMFPFSCRSNEIFLPVILILVSTHRISCWNILGTSYTGLSHW